MVRRRYRLLILIAAVLPVIATPGFSNDRIQRSVAAIEAFVPVALLVTQGADTPFELGVVGASVLLQSVPNALMLFAESAEYPQLTRVTRWINFGIDAGLAGGLLGVGVAYLAGAFGPEADLRARGAAYLALSIPAGIAAFSDFLPYSLEPAVPPRRPTEESPETELDPDAAPPTP